MRVFGKSQQKGNSKLQHTPYATTVQRCELNGSLKRLAYPAYFPPSRLGVSQHRDHRCQHRLNRRRRAATGNVSQRNTHFHFVAVTEKAAWSTSIEDGYQTGTCTRNQRDEHKSIDRFQRRNPAQLPKVAVAYLQPHETQRALTQGEPLRNTSAPLLLQETHNGATVPHMKDV